MAKYRKSFKKRWRKGSMKRRTGGRPLRNYKNSRGGIRL